MPAAISEYTPQVARDDESARRARVGRGAWGVVVAGAALLVSLIVGAPLLRAAGAVGAAQTIYLGFSAACHQIDARSFHVAGFQLAVCARCFGLYAGFAAGVALYPLARDLARRETPARKWLLLALVPVSADFALGFLGLWENTHLSRAATGALLGAVAAFYVVPGLMELSRADWRRLRTRAAAECGGADTLFRQR
jgi:uncharacterized membrane protein